MIIACVHTFFFKHVNFANFSDINLRELICKIYHVRANKMYTALIFSNFSTSNHGIFYSRNYSNLLKIHGIEGRQEHFIRKTGSY